MWERRACLLKLLNPLKVWPPCVEFSRISEFSRGRICAVERGPRVKKSESCLGAYPRTMSQASRRRVSAIVAPS
jgi:hypothetical protein